MVAGFVTALRQLSQSDGAASLSGHRCQPDRVVRHAGTITKLGDIRERGRLADRCG